MALLALATYWLVRSTPIFLTPAPTLAPPKEPDYFMRGFAVKTFDANGRLKSEVAGQEARHFPADDTLEIDLPRLRAVDKQGNVSVGTAERGRSNGDGSEVQLIGKAVVAREAVAAGAGVVAAPRIEYRGEFLHAFVREERVRSHKPVQIRHGASMFTADAMDYDHLSGVVELRGRVRGTLAPPPKS